MGELIAKAKTDSKMSYGSAGAGTTMHIAAEQLNVSAGTKITHVPYRGIAPRSMTSWAGTSTSSTATSRCSIRW
jgi:tripartite-type tricarboxylate transporter receptor subunit TctC